MSIDKKKRGRPARITREQILAETGKIPFESLTMPALANALKVETPALYHHFKSREDLIRTFGRQLFEELSIPKSDPDNWRQWIHDINMRLYKFVVKHPLLIEVGLYTEAPMAGTLPLCEAILETLQEAGFEDQESHWIMISLSQIAYAAARTEHEGVTKETLHHSFIEETEFKHEPMPRTAKLVEAFERVTMKSWLAQMLHWCIGCIPEPSKRP